MILSSDFDNTLYFHDSEFKEEDLKAIKKFQEAGGKFGICTGRPLFGIVEPTQNRIHYDYYICNSGGSIYDENYNLLKEITIDYKLMQEVYHHIGIDVSIVYDNKMNFYYTSKSVPFDLGEYGRILTHIDELETDTITAFSFHFPNGQLEEARKACQFINEHYGDSMSAYQNNEHVDVCGVGCSKGNGVHFIEDYFHIDNKNSSGIGDSFNDLPLLIAAGHSFTFDYAPDTLKEKADHIVENIAEAIEILLS